MIYYLLNINVIKWKIQCVIRRLAMTIDMCRLIGVCVGVSGSGRVMGGVCLRLSEHTVTV